jgi:hypothetical protein
MFLKTFLDNMTLSRRIINGLKLFFKKIPTEILPTSLKGVGEGEGVQQENGRKGNMRLNI